MSDLRVTAGQAVTTGMNIFNYLEIAMQDGELIAEEVANLEVDAVQIKAGEPATVNVQNIGGSIEGVKGVFSATVTFTPTK